MGVCGCGERGIKRGSIFWKEQVGGDRRRAGRNQELHFGCFKFEMPVQPLSREVSKKPVAVGV